MSQPSVNRFYGRLRLNGAVLGEDNEADFNDAIRHFPSEIAAFYRRARANLAPNATVAPAFPATIDITEMTRDGFPSGGELSITTVSGKFKCVFHMWTIRDDEFDVFVNTEQHFDQNIGRFIRDQSGVNEHKARTVLPNGINLLPNTINLLPDRIIVSGVFQFNDDIDPKQFQDTIQRYPRRISAAYQAARRNWDERPVNASITANRIDLIRSLEFDGSIDLEETGDVDCRFIRDQEYPSWLHVHLGGISERIGLFLPAPAPTTNKDRDRSDESVQYYNDESERTFQQSLVVRKPRVVKKKQSPQSGKRTKKKPTTKTRPKPKPKKVVKPKKPKTKRKTKSKAKAKAKV